MYSKYLINLSSFDEVLCLLPFYLFLGNIMALRFAMVIRSFSKSAISIMPSTKLWINSGFNILQQRPFYKATQFVFNSATLFESKESPAPYSSLL